jgi:hypothetical protein
MEAVPADEEPVTFRFGGALIEMKDDAPRPKAAAIPADEIPTPVERHSNPVLAAILGFVIIAVVLGVVFYLITQRSVQNP